MPLGAALTAGNQWGQAIDIYPEALRLAPDNANAHNSLGVALAATGRIEEGLAQTDQAVALSPNDPEIVKNRAWLAGYLSKRHPIPRP